MASYTFRKSALTEIQTFSLQNQSLIIEEVNAKSIEIPLNAIKTIRLSFMPDRARKNNFHCNIETEKGKHTFMSSSFVSFFNFKDDNEGYTLFVKQLIEKTIAANPNVQLLSGRPKASYYLSVTFMLICYTVLGMVIYHLGSYMSSLSFLKFILILLMVPIVYAYIVKNKPGKFTAENIPANLLPQ